MTIGAAFCLGFILGGVVMGLLMPLIFLVRAESGDNATSETDEQRGGGL